MNPKLPNQCGENERLCVFKTQEQISLHLEIFLLQQLYSHGCSEQTPGADNQNDCGYNEYQGQSPLGPKEDGKGIDLTNDDRSNQRSKEASEPSDNDHTEGLDNDRHVHAQGDRTYRGLYSPGGSRDEDSQHKDSSVDPGNGNPQSTDHFPAEDCSPDDMTILGLFQKPPQSYGYGNTHQDDEDEIGINGDTKEKDRPCHLRRPYDDPVLHPPGDLYYLAENQDHSIGEQQLLREFPAISSRTQ